MKNHYLLLIFALLTFSSLAQKRSQHYDNGNLKVEEELKDGHSIGKTTYFYETGNKKTEVRYDNEGVMIGFTQWDETGKTTVDRDLLAEQKAKGRTNLSKIKWTTDNKIDFDFINEVNGKLPTKGDTVSLNYIGYFKNGI